MISFLTHGLLRNVLLNFPSFESSRYHFVTDLVLLLISILILDGERTLCDFNASVYLFCGFSLVVLSRTAYWV